MTLSVANRDLVAAAKPLGTYEEWAAWCRDPLVALGCADPVKRIAEIKERDPVRQSAIAMMAAWSETYKNRWVELRELDDNVLAAAGLKYDATAQAKRWRVEPYVGMRVGGYILKKREATAKRDPALYCVLRVKDKTAEPSNDKAAEPSQPIDLRKHPRFRQRGHGRE
jgi:hypothetical protein